MATEHYTILLRWSPDDEAFLADVIELPGCISHGTTRAEAITNAEIAILNWTETAKELGRDVPDSDKERQKIDAYPKLVSCLSSFVGGWEGRQAENLLRELRKLRDVR